MWLGEFFLFFFLFSFSFYFWGIFILMVYVFFVVVFVVFIWVCFIIFYKIIVILLWDFWFFRGWYDVDVGMFSFDGSIIELLVVVIYSIRWKIGGLWWLIVWWVWIWREVKRVKDWNLVLVLKISCNLKCNKMYLELYFKIWKEGILFVLCLRLVWKLFVVIVKFSLVIIEFWYECFIFKYCFIFNF